VSVPHDIPAPALAFDYFELFLLLTLRFHVF